MGWFYKLRMVYRILLPVSITLVIVLATLSWQIQSKGSDIVQAVAERELVALGGQYSGDVRRFIEQGLIDAINMADTIADLEEIDQALDREQIIAMLTNAQMSESFIGTGVAFLPTSEDAQYANMRGSDANGQFIPQITSSELYLMDTSFFEDSFFTEPQKTKKAYISEPYIYQLNEREYLVLTISAPIIVDDVFKGIVYIDFSLENLADMVKDIQVYSSGSMSVTTQDGTVLADRNTGFILQNILALDDWRNNTELLEAYETGSAYLYLAAYADGESFFYFHPFIFPQTGQVMYSVVIVPLAEVLADVGQLTNITLIASALALLTLLFVVFIGVRSSMKPLAAIVYLAEEVTRGNYEAEVDSSKFGGEILDLKKALDAMLSSLVENINKAEAMSNDAQLQTLKAQEATHEADLARVAAEGAKREGMLLAADQLEGIVSIISTASQELSTQIEQSEHSSEEQAQRVTETATAMEEMNITVLEVARNAGSAFEISSQTRTRANVGASVVEEAIAGIEHVQSVSLALKSDMNILANQAKAISEIMNVISDIADQTNLLALNAAIEAARAGDAGRGFAVVADEVRKLAEKTMMATTDVGNTIKSIQASVDVSITQVDHAVELIGISTQQVSQSGEALSDIVVLVDSTADQVHAIATASEEQSATSDEINRAIIEINSISTEGAQNMREAASAVNDLALQTQALSRLIEEMKQS